MESSTYKRISSQDNLSSSHVPSGSGGRDGRDNQDNQNKNDTGLGLSSTDSFGLSRTDNIELEDFGTREPNGLGNGLKWRTHSHIEFIKSLEGHQFENSDRFFDHTENIGKLSLTSKSSSSADTSSSDEGTLQQFIGTKRSRIRDSIFPEGIEQTPEVSKKTKCRKDVGRSESRAWPTCPTKRDSRVQSWIPKLEHKDSESGLRRLNQCTEVPMLLPTPTATEVNESINTEPTEPIGTTTETTSTLARPPQSVRSATYKPLKNPLTSRRFLQCIQCRRDLYVIAGIKKMACSECAWGPADGMEVPEKAAQVLGIMGGLVDRKRQNNYESDGEDNYI